MISLIWAMAEDQLIGKDNKIPWHVKEDLIYYKNKTAGKVVLMGEATYYSLKGYYKTKPLPYGKIYVASFNTELKLDDAVVINNAIEFLKNNEEDLWVVGGASIYKISLPYADRLYISYIKGEYTGDTYFPHIEFDKFNLVWQNETEKVRYTLYERVIL